MADIELVIKISEEIYQRYKKVWQKRRGSIPESCIAFGTPLPKGHGDIFDKTEILRLLKCPEYETCDWKNCSDCNRSCCINLNNVNDLVPIIEADTTRDCKTCGHSNDGKCAGTEECHDCMWESKYIEADKEGEQE